MPARKLASMASRSNEQWNECDDFANETIYLDTSYKFISMYVRLPCFCTFTALSNKSLVVYVSMHIFHVETSVNLISRLFRGVMMAVVNDDLFKTETEGARVAMVNQCKVFHSAIGKPITNATFIEDIVTSLKKPLSTMCDKLDQEFICIHMSVACVYERAIIFSLCTMILVH